MRRHTAHLPLALTCALTLALAGCARRHPIDDAARAAVTAPLTIEGVALDSALAMHAQPNRRHLVLDTMYAVPRTAPGQRTTAMRPMDRSVALAKGRPLRLGGVPRNDEAGLLLSPPQLAGDSAAITVTFLARASQAPRAAYETVEWRLHRDASGTWRVIGRRRLGNG